MKFDNFRITAEPIVSDAYCNCGKLLDEVSNGFLSSVWYCKKCENIYALKLIKVASEKIKPAFLEQCRDEITKKISDGNRR